MRLFMSSRALKMLGEGLAAEIELYECFWGNLGIYPPTQINGTLNFELGCQNLANRFFFAFFVKFPFIQKIAINS